MWPFKNREKTKKPPARPEDSQDDEREDTAAWVDEIEDFMAIFED